MFLKFTIFKHRKSIILSLETDTAPPTVTKCCRTKGVPDDCFGYCEEFEGDTERGATNTGNCKEWFGVITGCIRKGTFILFVNYSLPRRI